MGLRELKKKRTRKAISDMATALFAERGYHEVTTAEIAERAEVSVPTLFNYFSTKESLVFDEDSETEHKLVKTVENRREGQSILDALLDAGFANIDSIIDDDKTHFADFMALVEHTPELSLYAQQMWMRHEKALATAIRREAKNKMGKLESEAVARFVLDSYHRSLRTPNPKESLRTLFSILREGWVG